VKRIWVLMAVCFVDMIGLMMILPLLPLYAGSLGAGPLVVGLLTASFPVAQLASSPFWGRVSDRHGRRPAILIGLAASAVAYTIFAFADALWLLFACRFAQGLGGGTTGVAQAYVTDSVLPSDRAKALGWLSAATSAGVIVGPGLGSLSANLGSAAPGLVAAALVLGNMAFAWKWLPESRPTRFTGEHEGAPAAARPQRSVLTAVLDVVRHPASPVAFLIWIYAVAMLPYNGTPPVFSLYLSERFAIAANEIGYFFIVFGAIGVIMRTAPVGWVNARLGEARTMRVGAALLALGYFLIPFAVSVPQFIAAQMLIPIGTALLFPANSALVSHKADRREVGLTLGVQQTFRGVSAIVGPIWAGWAYQALGRTVPFFLFGTVLSVVFVLALRVRDAAPAREASPAVTPAG
jgi:MFS family permease